VCRSKPAVPKIKTPAPTANQPVTARGKIFLRISYSGSWSSVMAIIGMTLFIQVLSAFATVLPGFWQILRELVARKWVQPMACHRPDRKHKRLTDALIRRAVLRCAGITLLKPQTYGFGNGLFAAARATILSVRFGAP
jgi:hypothetical protein